MAADVNGDFDPQDQAEVFDEDNTGGLDDAGEMLTLEEMPDVLDVTSAAGDADDEVARIGEEMDDDEIIALEADAADADIEDDDLRGRMPEEFDDDVVREGEIEELRFAEETSFAVDDDDEVIRIDGHTDRAMSEANDDADIEFTADVDALTDLDEDDASVMESDTVSDEDLTRLGYSNEHTAGER